MSKKQKMFTGWLTLSRDGRRLGIRIVTAFIASCVLLSLILSLFMSELRATYVYDNGLPRGTDIPFSAHKESDYLNVEMRFALNPLHVTHFVIGPDDCIEELTINGTPVPELQGYCNKHPGTTVKLPNLQRENVVRVRIHDTGGTGGIIFRSSWMDPMVLLLTGLWLLIVIYMLTVALYALGARKVTLLLPGLLTIALVLRIGIAWHGGFGGDIGMYKTWAQSAVVYGPGEAYSRSVNPDVMMPNYPPLSMLMLNTVGHTYQKFVSPQYNAEHPVYHVIIKLPAILTDLATAVLLYLLLVPLGSRLIAFAATTFYALNPAVIHNSSVWGQTDALFTFGLCLLLFCLQRKWWFAAGMCLATAMLLKMQAIIAIPVLAVAILPATRRWLYVALGTVTVTVLVLLPFASGDALTHVWNVYTNSVGFYSSLSSNAYNLWVMLFTRDTGKASTDLVLGLLSFRHLGILLWVGTVAACLNAWFGAIHEDIRTHGKNGMLLLSSAIVAYAFFMLNAEMHERYLFPYMAFALPLLFIGKRGVWLYGWSTVLFTLNLISIVAFTDIDRILFQEYIGDALPMVVATGQMIVFVLTMLYIQRYQASLKGHRSFSDIVWPHCRKALRQVTSG